MPTDLARRADDFSAERLEEAVQLVDICALAGAEAEVVQADALLFEGAPACSGDGALMSSAVRPPTQ